MGEGFDLGIEKPHLRGEKSGALESMAIEDEAHHGWHIDGMREGSSHERVLEERAFEVPSDVGVAARRGREDIEARVVHEGIHGPRLSTPKVHLSGFKGETQRELVGHEPVNDPIHPRAGGIEVIWIPLHADEFVGLPLCKAERARSNRRAIEVLRPPARGLSLEKMRGEERNHPALQRRRVGLSVGHAKREIVRCLDIENQIKVGFARGCRGVVHDSPVGEGGIARGEGRAIMPADIFAKMENHLRLGEEGQCLSDLHCAASVGSEPFFDLRLEIWVGCDFKSRAAVHPHAEDGAIGQGFTKPLQRVGGVFFHLHPQCGQRCQGFRRQKGNDFFGRLEARLREVKEKLPSGLFHTKECPSAPLGSQRLKLSFRCGGGLLVSKDQCRSLVE